LSEDFQKYANYVLNKPQVFTHSVHITIGFDGGHLRLHRIHHVSYIIALKKARNSPSQIKHRS